MMKLLFINQINHESHTVSPSITALALHIVLDTVFYNSGVYSMIRMTDSAQCKCKCLLILRGALHLQRIGYVLAIY